MGLIAELVRARREVAARGHPLLRKGRDYVERPNSTLLRVIPAGASVLDIGCGRGVNLAALAARGRRSYGVELDPSAVDAVRARGLEACQGDVRDSAFRERILAEKGQFDVLLFADLLEHIVEPHEVLLGALPLLAPGGCVVISMPNVAVWFQRLALLAGRFEYDDTGILDRSHLRFFTRDSLDRWLRSAGLDPVRWDSTPSLVASTARFLRPLARQRSEEMSEAFGPAFDFYLRRVEPVEHALCNLWPSLLAFQHVVVARPAAARRAEG